MKYQIRGFQLSFLIHALALIGIVVLSRAGMTSKLLVLDFSLENAGSAAKEEVRKVSPEKRLAAPDRVGRERQQKPGMQKEKILKDTPALPPPRSENQAPVAAKEIKHVETAAVNSEVHNKAGGPPVSQEADPVSATQRNTKSPQESGQEGPEENKARYLRENFSYIRDLVQKRIVYPRMARDMGWEGKVTVSFVISREGHVTDIRITQSSGVELLDKNALEAVKTASPFPEPLAAAQITIPVVYRLH